MSPMLTLGGHDRDLSPSLLQCAQPSLIFTNFIDAGGADAQLHVGVLSQECSQILGTVMTGAIGDVTGDPVLRTLVQRPRWDLVQEAHLCMENLSTEEGGIVLSLAVNRGKGGPR